METIKYSFIVSPENIVGDLIPETYSGDSGLNTFNVYTGFSYTLSGNTGGTSFLTGLTIPIMFTQTINDLGIYDEFDGLAIQNDVITNFLYSGDSNNPYKIYAYNTSGNINISFLDFTTYHIDWGDNTVIQQITNQPLSHIYPTTPQTYTITFSGQNNWGTSIIQKQVIVPMTGVTINNLNGTVSLIPHSGNWSGIPMTYDFIFTGDSQNNIQSQISSTYTTVPFPVSGYTNSKLINLKRWGPDPYTIGYIFYKNNLPYGLVNDITSEYTAYTIDNVQYYDFTNGKTFYIVDSSGITSNDIVDLPITKNEYLLDFVMDPEIQSDVYIERGKYTAFEPLQRLGEVDNIGDLVRYGYGYFKINQT